MPRHGAPVGVVVPTGISSGGQMLWQAALQPFGFVYRALPEPWTTTTLPNPVRNASLTTSAVVAVGPGLVWAAAMPAVAAVTPPARTAATTTRDAREMPRGPPARRKVNLIDAPPPLSPKNPAATRYHVHGSVRGSPPGRMGSSAPRKNRSGRSSR